MQPHYLVLIAKQKETDAYYQGIKTAELSVEGNRLMLTKKKPNGEALPAKEVERTYIILKVSKSTGFDIKRLIDSSTTAWGTFGRKQFRGQNDSGIKKEELTAFAASLLNRLESFGDLLQDEV
ncbi:MAG TPA: hypothetical protein VN844_12780 [Pyrinomonadaceae bacterium]|nr:hypothetical protein [Pyrinomonadaceae bacterium]